MKDVLVDTEGFNQYYEELNRLKDLSLSIASIGSESYADAVGDGWHDNFAFEDTMRESRKIASRINKMLEDEKYLKIVDKKSNSDDIIDIGDILKIKVIYDIDDIEEFTYKDYDEYIIDNNIRIGKQKNSNFLERVSLINKKNIKNIDVSLNPLIAYREENKKKISIYNNGSVLLLKGDLFDILKKIIDNKYVINAKDIDNLNILLLKGCLIAYEK